MILSATDLARGIGFVFGMVSIVVAWYRIPAAKPDKESGFLKDRRIQAMVWGVATCIVAFVGAWDDIFDKSGAAGLDRTALALAYLGGWIAGSIGSLILFCVVSAIWVASHTGGGTLRKLAGGLRAAVGYLSEGYGYLKQVEQDAGDIAALRNHSRQRAKKLSALISAVLRCRQQGNTADLGRLTFEARQKILESICDVARLYMASNANTAINANYMRAVPWSAATRGQHAASLKFIYGNEARYGHLLVIEQYADPNLAAAMVGFALAVEKRQISDWKEWVLPGAPEAFLGRATVVVGRRDFNYGRHVEPAIRHQIEDYLRQQPFKCFLSTAVPVQVSGEPAGVVNIESGEDILATGGSSTAEELSEILYPFTMLLGHLP